MSVEKNVKIMANCRLKQEYRAQKKLRGVTNNTEIR
jgi:hypothetical protein